MDAVSLRLVLVEDHRFFRQGLRDLLVEHGHRVVGEAATAREGLRLTRELAPDVLILDLGLPGIPGFDVIDEARRHAPVLVMTASAAQEDLLAALHAGAAGYLLKDAPVEEMLAGIHAVAAGDSAISPPVAAKLVDHVRQAAPAAAAPPAPQLSGREAEVLRLLAAGLDNAAIAERLHLGTGTVKAVVSALLDRLDADNRVQLAVRAVTLGLS